MNLSGILVLKKVPMMINGLRYFVDILELGALIDFLQTLTDTSGLMPGHIELPLFEQKEEWNTRTWTY